jgi:predicted MFS family arabinose efflux permease
VVSEELSARNRGFGLGVLSAVGGMGGALTLLVYAFVDKVPYGWRFLFIVGGFGLLCVPWLWRSLNETRRFSEHQDLAAVATAESSLLQPLVDIGRHHRWRLLALVGVIAPVWVILEPGTVFVSKHLQDDLGYSPAQVSLLMAICGIATPLGNMLGGTVSDRIGRRPVTGVVSLMLSAAVALFYLGSGVFVVGLGLALVMMSLGALQVLQAALSTELFPTGLRSTAAGVREAVATLGASVGLVGLSVLFATTGSHAESIVWLLVLTPVAPIILFFVPETAGRELEEIGMDRDDRDEAPDSG